MDGVGDKSNKTWLIIVLAIVIIGGGIYLFLNSNFIFKGSSSGGELSGISAEQKEIICLDFSINYGDCSQDVSDGYASSVDNCLNQKEDSFIQAHDITSKQYKSLKNIC